MYTASKKYSVETRFQGWTRIDMLLALYDRTIANVKAAQQAKASDQTVLFGEKMLDAQKCLFGLFSGLKPEQDEIAFNNARLLHFAMGRLIENQFDDVLLVLESIRNGFESIREEATQLEKEGHIPPMEPPHSVCRTA